MTVTETLHRFFAEMTYGYDQGVTELRLTPMIYRKLVEEFMEQHSGSLPGYDPFPQPQTVMFEGRLIIRGQK